MNKTNSMGSSLSIEQKLAAEALAESEVAELYATFPRNKRGKLHDAILKDKKSPFRYGPDDGPDDGAGNCKHTGRIFAVILSDFEAPVTNMTFSEILDDCLQLKGKNRAAMVQCFRTHMHAIQKI